MNIFSEYMGVAGVVAPEALLHPISMTVVQFPFASYWPLEGHVEWLFMTTHTVGVNTLLCGTNSATTTYGSRYGHTTVPRANVARGCVVLHVHTCIFGRAGAPRWRNGLIQCLN